MLKCNKLLKFASAFAIVGLVAFGYDVLAETPEEQAERLKDYENKCDVETISSKYDIDLRKTSTAGNQYIIDVNGEDAGDVEFKVTKINTGTLIGDINALGTIKKGQPLYLNIEASNGDVSVDISMKTTDIDAGCLGTDDEEYATTNNISYSVYSQTLTFESMSAGTGNIYQGSQTIANPHKVVGGICTNFINGNYDANQFNNSPIIKKEDFDNYNYAVVSDEGKQYYKDLIPYCFKDNVDKNMTYEDSKLVELISDAISIWKKYTMPVASGSGNFLTTFNAIKNAAIAAGNNKGTYAAPVAKGTALSYENKCAYDQNDKVTKNYYSAQVVDSQSAQYVYNYAPGNTVTDTKSVCDRICEEAVKIEYGPPQATKAGLCFEYTVKVESYVVCNASIKPNSEPNPYNGSYGWPGGECKSQKGTIRSHVRAGPTEDFDRCIRNCDGGKYTQSCSLKCYNKVYKNSKNLKISYANILNNGVKKMSYSLSECLADNPDGCYIYSGSSIHWRENPATYDRNSSDSLARYYFEPGTEGPALDGASMGTWYSYIADEDGFKRANYSGTLCDDICYWLPDSVSRTTYLNPGTGQADHARNVEAYNSAVTACRASASCSRTTKKYSISVKYETEDNDGNVTVNQVYFPYTSDSQLKKNPSGGEYNLVDKDQFVNGAGYKNEKSTIINYDGCYKDSVNNTNWYLTEWGFPGTYINNKTGDISFAEPTDMSGWYKEKQKFCVPLNALSTNKKWWEWKVMGSHCVNVTAADIDYNIEAVVEDFGYFDWDFKVQCFYGMYDECKVPNENACCPQPCIPGDPTCLDTPPPTERELQYVIRTVDRADVFPNSDYSIPEEQRRTIGFNWTSRATIPSLKGNDLGGYWGVNPEEYRESIETNASTLYSGDPDYEFYLTPTALRKLRSYNDRYSYGTWNGKVSEINGITAYQSNLFRTVGIESNVLPGDAIKQTGEPGVNNE